MAETSSGAKKEQGKPAVFGCARKQGTVQRLLETKGQRSQCEGSPTVQI